jgi:DNA-binding winged helix-turn-helix (wHTH) protein
LSQKIDVIVVGAWRAERATGDLIGPSGTERLEPKVMDLLFLLAERPGQAFSKDEIMERLWPNVVVAQGVG